MEQTEYKIFFYEEGIFKDFLKYKCKKRPDSTNMLLKRSLALGNLNIEVTQINAILNKWKIFQMEHNGRAAK